MLTPMLGGAIIALLVLGVAERPAGQHATQPCGALMVAAEPAVMTDAVPDAASYAVAAASLPCSDAGFVRTAMMSTDAPPPADVSLEWPGDFVILTLKAALAVWDTTIWALDEVFAFALRNVSALL